MRLFYSGNWSEQISQSKVVEFHSRLVSISPRIITKTGFIATAKYAFTYSQMQSTLDIFTAKLPRMKTLSQKMDLNIFPTNKTMWFGDNGVKYKMKRVEFLLDWNNVFNTSSYVVSLYAETGRYFYSYNLRPSEVLLRVRFNIL